MNFLITINCILKDKHDFVSKKCCLTNLIESLDYIISRLFAVESVDVIFLDFLNPFYMVSHMRFMNKLRGYGLEDKLID